ncbi:hypothetical protein [Paludifilum halophilum]|uniref:Uncharacterized protein n=1 Tax=Paludifilum halophilum TaxID=1642702 RepID=A0A235B9Z6_9BACL|nr:hypothetical protein [Paludifilum halophilum]OYD09128.1 hypothetical protein CHM34_05015 [Paludifilum halophilum]
MAEETVEIVLDSQTHRLLHQLAEREGADLSRLLLDTALDRSCQGELKRAQCLLEEFAKTLKEVVEESETLSRIAPSEKELFLASVDGSLMAYEKMLPRRVAELRTSHDKERDSETD